MSGCIGYQVSQLIQEILKGDRRAQGRFYDEFSPLVMGICMRYMKSHEAASDVFQEAFIKIFNNLGQVKNMQAVAGWIKRITVNTALDHLRVIRYDHDVFLEANELSDQFYSDLIDKLSTEVILQAVNNLAEGYRVIFNMSVIDGFSHKEIANELGISESTSRSQLTHARHVLKRYLNELGITRYEQVI